MVVKNVNYILFLKKLSTKYQSYSKSRKVNGFGQERCLCHSPSNDVMFLSTQIMGALPAMGAREERWWAIAAVLSRGVRPASQGREAPLMGFTTELLRGGRCAGTLITPPGPDMRLGFPPSPWAPRPPKEGRSPCRWGKRPAAKGMWV